MMNKYLKYLHFGREMMNKYLKYLLIAGLLMLPGFAFAGNLTIGSGNSIDMYALGNGQALFTVLNSITALLDDPQYQNLLKAIAVLAIFIVAAVSGFNMAGNGHKILSHIFKTYVVLYLVSGVTANITINDELTGKVYVASNTSAMVGVPAALISQVGHFMTKKIEQTFNFPNGMAMSAGGGYGMAAAMLKDLDTVTITEPILRANMANYSKDCLIPMMANGTINMDDLLTQGNTWQLMSANNPAIVTAYREGKEINIYGCDVVYGKLTVALDAAIPRLMSEATGDWSGSGAMSAALDAQLAASTAFSSNDLYSGSSADLIKQAAVVNSLRNGTAFSESLARGQGVATQGATWSSGGEIFKRLAGYLHGALQVFTLAIVPIVALMLLLPGAGITVGKNFVQMLAWLVLWEPLLAVVNFVVMSYSQSELTAIWGSAGVLTYQTIPAMSAAATHIFEAGGYLAMSVPVLAWSLVKVMSDVPVQFAGVASQTGAAMATGNVSHQQISMNNVNRDNISQRTYASDNSNFNNTSANKHDTASQTTTGTKQDVNYTSDGSTRTVNETGGGTTQVVNGQTQTKDFSASRSQQATEAKRVSEEWATRYEASKNNTEQIAKAATTAYAASTGYSLENGVYLNNTNGESVTQDQMKQRAHAHAEEVHTASEQAKTSTVTKDVSLGLNVKAGGGVAGAVIQKVTGLNAEIVASANISKSGVNSDSKKEGTSVKDDISKSESTSDRNTQTHGTDSGKTHRHSNTDSKTLSTNESTAKLNSMSEAWLKSEAETQSFLKSKEESETRALAYTVKTTAAQTADETRQGQAAMQNFEANNPVGYDKPNAGVGDAPTSNLQSNVEGKINAPLQAPDAPPVDPASAKLVEAGRNAAIGDPSYQSTGTPNPAIAAGLDAAQSRVSQQAAETQGKTAGAGDIFQPFETTAPLSPVGAEAMYSTEGFTKPTAPANSQAPTAPTAAPAKAAEEAPAKAPKNQGENKSKKPTEK